MTKESVKKITTESLINQKKGHKVLLWALIGLTIALLSFPIYDMIKGKGQEYEVIDFIMPLCTIGGAVSVWMEMNIINKELSNIND